MVNFKETVSSETQGQLVGPGGNKSRKEMKRRMLTSKAGKAPGNRLLPDHFQTALPMLLPDWAEKSFVLFCPISEQLLLRYFGVLFNLLQRAIEIQLKRKTLRDSPEKNFVSTDQRYRKIVDCLLAS